LQPASIGLEKIVVASFKRMPSAEAALSAWPLVCGSAVAERTRAESFADGILRVTVADPAWKRELQMLAPRYVATLNKYVGQRVERIEFLIPAASTQGIPAPPKKQQ
jgi:predicted nucleic acid-binding Zn ribbon protein